MDHLPRARQGIGPMKLFVLLAVVLFSSLSTAQADRPIRQSACLHPAFSIKVFPNTGVTLFENSTHQFHRKDQFRLQLAEDNHPGHFVLASINDAGKPTFETFFNPEGSDHFQIPCGEGASCAEPNLRFGKVSADRGSEHLVVGYWPCKPGRRDARLSILRHFTREEVEKFPECKSAAQHPPLPDPELMLSAYEASRTRPCQIVHDKNGRLGIQKHLILNIQP